MDQTYRVLVIDDSPFVLKAVKKALEPEGYQLLDQAFNGKMGLEMAARLKPDLILLDVTMPEMDGFETAEHLLRENADIKIVMLSAMGDQKLLQKAKQIGVRAFLPKPFQPDEIRQTVRSLLDA